jgi:hypothetical protein
MDFPLANGGIIKHDGVTTATSLGTTITTSATNNTKGSWTEVSAAAPNSVVGFWLCVYFPSVTRFMFDVAYGASNIVIADNLWSKTVTGGGGHKFWIPVSVPAGEPVQVRAQCYRTTGAGTCDVSIMWKCGTMVSTTPFGHAETYGAVTASTNGTTIDPGASANTKGAYVELAASTARDIRSALLCFGHGGSTVAGVDYLTATGNIPWLVDVAIGGAGSEAIRIPDIPVLVPYWSDHHSSPVIGPFDLFIPAGSRLSARAQCSSVDAAFRTVGLVIVGFN